MQTIRPNSDVTTAGWTSTAGTFHAAVSDGSDASYIEAPTGTDVSAPVELDLSNPAFHTTTKVVSFSVRARSINATGTGPRQLGVIIKQGATVLYTAATISLTSSFTTYTFNNVDLTGLTDWDALRVRFEFASAGPDAFGCDIAEFELNLSEEVEITHGEVALTANSPTARTGVQVAVTQASVTYAGQSATPQVGVQLPVTVGTVTYSGESPTARTGTQVLVTLGSLTFTGFDAVAYTTILITSTSISYTSYSPTFVGIVADFKRFGQRQIVFAKRCPTLTFTKTRPLDFGRATQD
jgi:hypothetical protein